MSNQFLPSYISPIVFDQKKFYTKNDMYLDEDSRKEIDLKNDIIFVYYNNIFIYKYYNKFTINLLHLLI